MKFSNTWQKNYSETVTSEDDKEILKYIARTKTKNYW